MTNMGFGNLFMVFQKQ